MGDRIDEGWMREQAAETRQERAKALKAAGPLLDEEKMAEMRSFLKNKCWMEPAAANDVIDTINSLAGEKGADARAVIRDALEGHVTAAFLKNENNFAPVTGLIGSAIAAREARIAALHKTMHAPSPAVPPRLKS
ncbi:MAG: hypothetical protein KGL10_00385 [Alphaproteobacteria bacterium]|nr:hypothetical protein [Alphaproteobacteria bacterium]MDE2335749.1 hypothetical protein [Alphaproteobacteria bacterium]